MAHDRDTEHACLIAERDLLQCEVTKQRLMIDMLAGYLAAQLGAVDNDGKIVEAVRQAVECRLQRAAVPTTTRMH